MQNGSGFTLLREGIIHMREVVLQQQVHLQ